MTKKIKRLSKEQLFKRAENGDVSVLSDPRVSKIRDGSDWSPLEILCSLGKMETLRHPDIDKIKDIQGDVPLYWLFDYYAYEEKSFSYNYLKFAAKLLQNKRKKNEN